MSLRIKKQKNSFAEFLKNISDKYKIAYISVIFTGSGDSGEIEEVTGLDKNSCFVEKCEFTQSERDTLISFFDSYLDSTGYDWYNNDGGNGEIKLNIETGEIEGMISINYMSSDDHDLQDNYFTKNYSI